MVQFIFMTIDKKTRQRLFTLLNQNKPGVFCQEFVKAVNDSKEQYIDRVNALFNTINKNKEEQLKTVFPSPLALLASLLDAGLKTKYLYDINSTTLAYLIQTTNKNKYDTSYRDLIIKRKNGFYDDGFFIKLAPFQTKHLIEIIRHIDCIGNTITPSNCITLVAAKGRIDLLDTFIDIMDKKAITLNLIEQFVQNGQITAAQKVACLVKENDNNKIVQKLVKKGRNRVVSALINSPNIDLTLPIIKEALSSSQPDVLCYILDHNSLTASLPLSVIKQVRRFLKKRNMLTKQRNNQLQTAQL